MTLLGKILTVLILVMSVVFMAFAMLVFATHKNWREHAKDLAKQVDDMRSQRDQMNIEFGRSKDALAAEQAARRFAIAAARSKYEQVNAALQQANTTLLELQSSNGVLTAAHRTTVTELERLTTEVAGLRKNIRDSQLDRDNMFNQVVRLTDELNRLEGLKSDLEVRRSQLLAQNSQLSAAVQAHGIDIHNIANIAPTVDGVVTGVSQKDLIEISIGSDDGIKEGHQLEVFRKSTYLGRVVIRKTGPDRAVAEIIKEYRRGIIRKGDRVATKLI
jgi:septal ring factor EnvC (AmiA/AmiB activator)